MKSKKKALGSEIDGEGKARRREEGKEWRRRRRRRTRKRRGKKGM